MTTNQKKGTFGILLIGIVLGVILWGGFNWALALTNTEQFCISCHEMRDNPYPDLQDTIHFTNRTGVRATCPDCHVPRPWIYKVIRKIQASNELYHHLKGTVDTPEKFEAKKFELAKHVWKTMKRTDSRECRNCHDYESMDFERQEPRAQEMHEEAGDKGYTCIDCHKGIAHQLPEEYDPDQDNPGESIYYQ